VSNKCWWCSDPAHQEACAVSYRQVDEEGICGCLRKPEETDEKVVAMLAPAIARALRGPTAKVRQSDVRKARAALGLDDRVAASLP